MSTPGRLPALQSGQLTCQAAASLKCQDRPHLPLLHDVSGRAAGTEAQITTMFAYDRHAALSAAQGVYHRMVRRLAGAVEINASWFEFSSFTRRDRLQEAVQVAGTADIIFCCPSSPHMLPPWAQDWIHQFLVRRNDTGGALAAILPVVPASSFCPTRIEQDLQETARIAGMAFFCGRYLPGEPDA